jgi:small-conductance mechanosensitive channel
MILRILKTLAVVIIGLMIFNIFIKVTEKIAKVKNKEDILIINNCNHSCVTCLPKKCNEPIKEYNEAIKKQRNFLGLIGAIIIILAMLFIKCFCISFGILLAGLLLLCYIFELNKKIKL